MTDIELGEIETITPYKQNYSPTAGVFTNPLFQDESTTIREKIRSFANLPENWDGLGTSAPTRSAIENALFIVKKLYARGIRPDSVNPTSDDSIFIQIHCPSLADSTERNHFYLFECFNDGDIVFLKKENGQRDVIDLPKSSVQNAIDQISSGDTNALF